MEREIIFIFVWIMFVLIMFILLNTVFGEYIFPTFDDYANQSSIEQGGFVNLTRYQARRSMITNVFYYVFAILIIIPFLYLIVRALLKREPEPQPYYPGGY